jgi:putative acetyltransferase
MARGPSLVLHYLHHPTLAPEHRGRGLGRRLVGHCLHRLAARGIDKCHAFVRAGNRTGAAFWRAVGWKERTDLKVMSKETRGPAR